jgi:hypothetical protein
MLRIWVSERKEKIQKLFSLFRSRAASFEHRAGPFQERARFGKDAKLI